MIKNKLGLSVFLVFSLIFIFIFSFVNINAVSCNYQPISIKVFSGDDYVGDALFDTIYIKNSLNDYPLKLEFYFENGIPNCFNSKDDLKFGLLSGHNKVSANSYFENEKDGIYRTLFVFDLSAQISFRNYFSATYFVKNDVYVNTIRFNLDSSKPIFDFLEISPIKDIYSSNDNISLRFKVTDSQSGLSKVKISGIINEVFDFENNKSFSFEKIFALSNKENLKIEVVDKSLNSDIKNFTFLIDDEPPEVVDSNLINSYEFDYSSKTTYVNIKAILKDKSFNVYDKINDKIIFDLGQINSNYSSIFPNCEKISNDYFSCEVLKVPISFNSTRDVNIKISVSDILGNNAEYSYTKKIFVDKTPVEIIKFDLINGIGRNNIFSGYDNYSYIYLKFKDDSLSSKENNPKIITNFGHLRDLRGNCSYDYIKKEGECTWPLKENSRLFLGEESGVFLISVRIIDSYLNPTESVKEVKYYNLFPQLDSFDIIETSDIKDGVFSSGEEVQFLIRFYRGDFGTIDNFNLSLNLSQITNDDAMANKISDLCRDYDNEIIECYFNNIILKDGYVNGTITGKLTNLVGLTLKFNKSIEILNISDEERKDFESGLVFNSLNPIERNALKETDMDIWYEGNFELVSPNNDLKIINFQLQNCEESTLNPLLFTSEGFSLYPDDVVLVNSSTNLEDVKFVLKSGIRRHENFNDMNDKFFNCTFAILKRDNTTIYSPELVNYSFKISFYNLPRGDLVKAYANDLLEDIKDVESTTGWFGDLYDIYSTLNTLCGAYYQVLTLVSIFSQIWTPTSYVLHSNPLTIGTAMAIDQTTYTSQEKTSTLDKIMRPMCSFVTCENGGLLNSALNLEFSDVPGLGPIFEKLDVLNDKISNSCADVTEGAYDLVGGGGN
jgi:hypothetical protein